MKLQGPIQCFFLYKQPRESKEVFPVLGLVWGLPGPFHWLFTELVNLELPLSREPEERRASSSPAVGGQGVSSKELGWSPVFSQFIAFQRTCFHHSAGVFCLFLFGILFYFVLFSQSPSSYS